MARISSTVRHESGDRGPTQLTPPDRLGAFEASVAAIQQTLDVEFERMVAMEAEVDHLTARKKG
jgi:hypothetical protein